MVTATKAVKPKSKRSLTLYEQETIINWNKEDKTASIFTYEKPLQQHLEKKLGLKPTLVNEHGGKGYEIDKKRIPWPRAPRKLTVEAKAKLVKRLAASRRNASESCRNTVVQANQTVRG